MRVAAVFLIASALASAVIGCGENPRSEAYLEQPPADSQGGARIALPQPRRQGSLSVEEALDRRDSLRSYADRAPSLADLGQSLWAAGGLGANAVSGASRTAPSAGGVYPLEFFLVTGGAEGLGAGVYRYQGSSHSLVVIRCGDARGELAEAALG